VPAVVATRFADAERIISLSGQHLVPIIEDDGRVIHDSWAIACHLEESYPDAPSLFGDENGRTFARFINYWADNMLMPPLRRFLCLDILQCLDPVDRAYFRASRETQFSAPLESIAADRSSVRAAFLSALDPLRATLDERHYLCGASPAYADYIIFSVFQHARVGTPFDLIPEKPVYGRLKEWRARMIGLYDRIGDRWGVYPFQDRHNER
jgi:glutathione S-transferase